MNATGASLVVLAAGRGTRFGGPKQLVAVRDDGSTITDILLHRAAAAGVAHAVIVVNPGIERRVAAHFDVTRPESRLELIVQHQPQGTADAVLAARRAVAGSIIVANADDLYPASAFDALAAHLRDAPAHEHGAIGFRLDRTRVGPRPESRALLDVGEAGVLRRICEAKIEQRDDGSSANAESGEVVDGEQLVSMNIWGFRPSVFDALELAVSEHGERGADGEVLLPDVVASMVALGGTVRVLPSEDTCLGLTYPEDLAAVRAAL